MTGGGVRGLPCSCCTFYTLLCDAPNVSAFIHINPNPPPPVILESSARTAHLFISLYHLYLDRDGFSDIAETFEVVQL